MENAERLKLSSNFISAKIFVGAFLCLLILFLSEYEFLESSLVLKFAFMFILLLLILVFILTRPSFYADKDNLYMVTKNEEIVIPFYNVESITYSFLGLGMIGNSFSYKIKYISALDNSVKKIRIYPSIKIDFETQFISIVRSINQNVKVISKGLWPFY